MTPEKRLREAKKQLTIAAETEEREETGIHILNMVTVLSTLLEENYE